MQIYAIIGFVFVWALVLFAIAFSLYMSIDYKRHWKKLKKPVRVDYGALPFEIRSTVSAGGLICVHSINIIDNSILTKSYFGLNQIKSALSYKKRLVKDFNQGAAWIGNTMKDKEEGK